jgi:tight adherence protein C
MDALFSFPVLLALSVMLFSLGMLWLMLLAVQRMRRARSSTFHIMRHSERLSFKGEISELLGESDSWLDRVVRQLARLVLEEGVIEHPFDEERRLLVQAGLRGSRALMVFSALRVGLPIAGVLLLSLSWINAPLGAQFAINVFTVVALGYLLPKWAVQWLARRRLARIAEELPLFVDFLRMLQGVGLNLEQSLLVVTDTQAAVLPVLAEEMRETMRQITSGRQRSAAFEKIAGELGVAELHELVAIIIQADRYGTPLQEPLTHLSRQLVERRRFEVQAQVGRVSAKMAVVMVLCLLPALLVVTAGPGFLAIMKALKH